MLNVNQITSQLARMGDTQLQQYARMHKNDPYIVSLALAESNRRKETRAGAQMNAPAQPRVVDQELAGMGAGLTALPADNLRGMEQSMAAGGIVAFDEGGEVPRYQSQGLVQSDAGLLGRLFNFYGNVTPAERARIEALQREKGLQVAGAAAPQVPVAPTERDVIAAMQPTAPPNMYTLDRSAAPAPETGAEQKTLPPPPRPQTRPAAVAPTAGLPGLISTPEAMQKALADAQKGITPEVPEALESGIKQLQTKEQALADANVKAIEAEQAARSPALQDFEKLLNERKERIGKRESDLGPLAMLQAGMAIMSGTSPFAAANIGAGAQVGLKAYTEGAEKLEAARDKMDEAFAKIEEVRRNESRMDAKELREVKAEAMKPAIAGQKLMLSALTDNWKLKHADAVKGVELLMRNQQSIYEQAQQTERARMQVAAQERIAGMPGAQERLFSTLGGGDVKKGLHAYSDIMGPEAKGMQALLTKYADPIALQTLKTTDPMLYAIVKQQLDAQLLKPTNEPTGPVRP